MKYSKYFLIVFSFVLLSCDKNEIIVNVDSSIVKKDIKINLRGLKDDKSLSDFVILENGVYGKIPNIYGENDWSLYYKDSLILNFRHIKTNRRNLHSYVFELEKVNNDILCNVSISGDNEFKINSKGKVGNTPN